MSSQVQHMYFITSISPAIPVPADTSTTHKRHSANKKPPERKARTFLCVRSPILLFCNLLRAKSASKESVFVFAQKDEKLLRKDSKILATARKIREVWCIRENAVRKSKNQGDKPLQADVVKQYRMTERICLATAKKCNYIIEGRELRIIIYHEM